MDLVWSCAVLLRHQKANFVQETKCCGNWNSDSLRLPKKKWSSLPPNAPSPVSVFTKISEVPDVFFLCKINGCPPATIIIQQPFPRSQDPGFGRVSNSHWNKLRSLSTKPLVSEWFNLLTVFCEIRRPKMRVLRIHLIWVRSTCILLNVLVGHWRVMYLSAECSLLAYAIDTSWSIQLMITADAYPMVTCKRMVFHERPGPMAVCARAAYRIRIKVVRARRHVHIGWKVDVITHVTRAWGSVGARKEDGTRRSIAVALPGPVKLPWARFTPVCTTSGFLRNRWQIGFVVQVIVFWHVCCGFFAIVGRVSGVIALVWY